MTYSRSTGIGMIALALLLSFTFVGFAHAQSSVSGTLTAGSSSNTNLTGTVATSSNSLSGTVVSTTTNGGGGGGGSSGGSSGGGGGSSGGGGFVDVCSNLDGTQVTVPGGYVLSGTTCVLSSGAVLGASTEVPNVPNTGAGGNALVALLTLIASLALALGGGAYIGYEVLGKRYN